MKTTSRASNNHTLDPETGAIRSDPTIQAIDVCFPGKTVEEAWRFSAQPKPPELFSCSADIAYLWCSCAGPDHGADT